MARQPSIFKPDVLFLQCMHIALHASHIHCPVHACCAALLLVTIGWIASGSTFETSISNSSTLHSVRVLHAKVVSHLQVVTT